MPLPSPNLDDRSFEQLFEEARSRIKQLTPQWTDLSESDPGIVLLQLFAYLTDTMIYRLNRLPQKAYIAFLNLLGVYLQPPAAASVDLVFSRTAPSEQPIEIPRGTRATVGRSGGGTEPPVFATDQTVTIPAGESAVTVRARHCELVVAELAGTGTGMPGLSITARKPPIIAPTGDDLDLLVGVEVTPEELAGRKEAIEHGNKAYRIWNQVESFSNLEPGSHVYVADRITGTISFAPAARMPGPDGHLQDTAQPIAAVPGAGREIRLWYRRGGGPEGNVSPGTLTTLRDPIPGVQVTNPNAATGGRAAETLENALVRGPQQFNALERALTARDYERVATSSSRAIARAKAFTRAALWTYATPGTVEVLLVPHLPQADGGGRVTLAQLREQQTEESRSQVQAAIDERRPLGTECLVSWASYKSVRVAARVVVRREEDGAAVRRRLVERLHAAVNPLPTPLNPSGWPFGQALRVSLVYDAALAEPGVRWVSGVRLLVDDVPQADVTSITADPSQASTWYVAAGDTLYRTLNDGDSWELVVRLAGSKIDVVQAHAERPGLVAIAAHHSDAEGGGNGSTIHISENCGESWGATPYTTAFRVEDIAWTLRGGVPFLLMAADTGLYELDVRPGGSPVQVLVEPSNQKLGFYAVAASIDVRGVTSVAVAAENTGGVYLSTDGGLTNTFRRIGLQGEDIRVLAVRYDGPRLFLWAGAASAGGEDPGKGCFSWELRGKQDPPEGWQSPGAGWAGGSCRALAFLPRMVLAASHRAGVLRLDLGVANPAWQPSSVRGGLPMRDPGRFFPVDAVASGPGGGWVMAGGGQGVYRSSDRGVSFRLASRSEFEDRVTLPTTWLFVSGEHEIEVVSEDEAVRD